MLVEPGAETAEAGPRGGPAGVVARPASRSAPVAWRLGAGAHLASGLLPGPAAGPSVSLSGRKGGGSLRVDAVWDSAAARTVGAGELDGNARWGALAACAHASRLAACGVVGAGALRLSGSDLGDAVGGGTRLVAMGGPRLVADLARFDAFVLTAHADGLFAATRTTVEVDGRSVWETPRVSFGGAVSAMVQMP
jgi:hypothetical protein